jgi:large subunit ribosomal protein L24
MIVRHQKPSEKHPEGGRLREETSLHISNVMHVDPKTKKPVRVGIERKDAGVRVLVAKGSNLEVRAL